MESLSAEVSTFSADLHCRLYRIIQIGGVILLQLLHECTDPGAASG